MKKTKLLYDFKFNFGLLYKQKAVSYSQKFPSMYNCGCQLKLSMFLNIFQQTNLIEFGRQLFVG